ncbi:MAG TPA: ATP-binding protein [Candidatus Obscuribacterales bacterium]
MKHAQSDEPYLRPGLRALAEMSQRPPLTAAMQAALATAPYGLLLLDPGGAILAANPAAARMLGLSTAELTSRSLSALLVQAQDLQQLLQDPAHPLLGRPREATGLKEPQQRIQIEMTLSCLPATEPPVFALWFHDISASRQVAQRLRETKARLETLIEHLHAGVLMESAGREILLANEAFCRIFAPELDPAELVGESCADLSVRTSLLFTRSRDHLRRIQALTAQGERELGEVLALADGRFLERDYLPIRFQSELIGHLWVYRDVSEKLRLEREREVMAKSEFLAMMSHEIRTPLNAMLGMLEVLEQTPLSSEQQQYLNLSRGSGHNLRFLLDNLLDFSRLEAGQMQLKEVVFDPHVLVAQSLESFGPRARQQGLDLKANLPKTLPHRLWGDAGRLSQVLFILLDNACKFTSKGQIAVEVVKVDAVDQGWALCWCVSDSGIGVAADKQTLIFERFEQADTSSTRRYGGSGLGLSIARQLVQLFGGKIWVESEPGSGSCFYFTLWLAEPAPEQAEAVAVRRELQPSQPLRILVAEDYPENQLLIRAYLQQSPCELCFAANGREAVALWQSWVPDLLLMDIQMPEMDGFEATAAIRAGGGRQPILAMTADAQPATRRRCFEAGCDEVLTKPVAQRELLDALSAWMAEAPETIPLPGVPDSWNYQLLPEITGLLPVFFELRAGEPEAIRTALAAGDFAAVARLGHGLKGVGASFGFGHISALGQALEAAANRQDERAVTELARELEAYLAWARAKLEAEGFRMEGEGTPD